MNHVGSEGRCGFWQTWAARLRGRGSLSAHRSACHWPDERGNELPPLLDAATAPHPPALR